MIANEQIVLFYSAISNRFSCFDSFPDAVGCFRNSYAQEHAAKLRSKLDAYNASDRNPIIESYDPVITARQICNSFHQLSDKYILTILQDPVHMPEDYIITLKS